MAVLVNRVYGSTFHRDEFSADNDHKIQCFYFDFWSSVELAETLVHSNANLNDSSQKRKVLKAQKILTARVMYTVGTLIALTDGSLELFVLDEKDDDGTDISLFEVFGSRQKFTPPRVLSRAA